VVSEVASEQDSESRDRLTPRKTYSEKGRQRGLKRGGTERRQKERETDKGQAESEREGEETTTKKKRHTPAYSLEEGPDGDSKGSDGGEEPQA
jgi:hypothetical protein